MFPERKLLELVPSSNEGEIQFYWNDLYDTENDEILFADDFFVKIKSNNILPIVVSQRE